MNKEELENKIKSLEREQTDYRQSKDRYNVVLKNLFEKANLSILEKLDLCFYIFEYIKIKRKKTNGKYIYIFETPIKAGWSTFQEESLEAGIEKLLSKN